MELLRKESPRGRVKYFATNAITIQKFSFDFMEKDARLYAAAFMLVEAPHEQCAPEFHYEIPLYHSSSIR